MRILLIGSGPLPGPGVRTMGFPSLRTAQFGAALVGAGHDVRVGLLVDAASADAPRAWRGPRPLGIEAVDAIRTVEGDPEAALLAVRREFEPDAVVTAGPFLPMALGAAVAEETPLWVDVPGDPMAEAQARAAADGDDAVLLGWRSVYLAALGRGDRFSAVSERQRAALMGALGVRGRLVAGTFGEPLVQVIPGSVEARSWAGDAPAGLDLPDDAFALLFAGGWNTWLDHPSMLRGVLAAMDAAPRLHFVATGGAIAGHHEGAYATFRAGALSSRHAERFHFAGWVDAARIGAIHRVVDAAVCVDRRCAEARLGARTRLLEALDAGLPVAATVQCEQTEALRGRPGFTELPLDDPAGVGAALAALVGADRVDWGGDRSIAGTTAALVAWAASPTRAAPGRDFGADAMAEANRLRAELDRVHATPTWRLLSRLHGRLKR